MTHPRCPVPTTSIRGEYPRTVVGETCPNSLSLDCLWCASSPLRTYPATAWRYRSTVIACEVDVGRPEWGTPCGNGPCQPGSLPGGVPYAPPEDDSRWRTSTGTADVPDPRTERRPGVAPIARTVGHFGTLGSLPWSPVDRDAGLRPRRQCPFSFAAETDLRR